MMHAFNVDIAYVDPISAPLDINKEFGLTRMELNEGLAWADSVSQITS